MNRICIIFAAFAVAACATKPPPAPPPPVTGTVDAPRAVQRACPDQRPPRPAIPEESEIAAVPDGDFEALGRIYHEALSVARALLALDEVQIRGCAAP